MTRQEFIRICSILGIGIPAMGALSSCESLVGDKKPFAGKVLVVGAGAVIINDIPSNSTVVGNPGRIIKTKI